MNGEVHPKAKPLRVLEKELLRKAGRAIRDYGMIREGERIAVAVSGGKDSFTLLRILRLLQQRAPVSFELLALNLHAGFQGYDPEPIRQVAEDLGIAFESVSGNIDQILHDKLSEGGNACFLCARLRRGILYTESVKRGCTRLALGHHADDTLETLLLNAFFTSQLKAMPPKVKSEDGRQVVIRPLIYAREDDIIPYAQALQFPVQRCNCPHETALEQGQRARVKSLLGELEAEFPHLKNRMLAALGRVRPSHLLDTSLHPFDE